MVKNPQRQMLALEVVNDTEPSILLSSNPVESSPLTGCCVRQGAHHTQLGRGRGQTWRTEMSECCVLTPAKSLEKNLAKSQLSSLTPGAWQAPGAWPLTLFSSYKKWVRAMCINTSRSQKTITSGKKSKVLNDVCGITPVYVNRTCKAKLSIFCGHNYVHKMHL
jgi:hypothetical protein